MNQISKFSGCIHRCFFRTQSYRRTRIIAAVSFVLLALQPAWTSGGHTKVYIWDGIPGMESSVKDSIMYVYPAAPDIANGAAVIICPGGSYHHLGMGAEGRDTAAWFNSIGVTAFLLCYRVNMNGYHHPAMLEDIQRAVQLIRQNAAHYGIDPAKVGAIGFSAGGHLVAMAGALSDTNTLEALGIAAPENLRPDFVVPVYPVVSMQDDIAHKRSRLSLLGRKYTDDQKNALSLELQIPADMPPVFLLACKDDPIVDYRNSVRLNDALLAQHIPCKFMLYETGKHAFGMKDGPFMKATRWNLVLQEWLAEIGMIPEEK